MPYLFPPPDVASVAIAGSAARFPVHRIYCVGRNYEEHAREMGMTDREPPFFFSKPADAVVAVAAGDTGAVPYPTLTKNLHHEVELVVALGRGGVDVAPAGASQLVYGYAVGLDMTRRDLQAEMRREGKPWSIAKGFDHSAPIGPITPVALAGDIARAEIALRVNGEERQRSRIDLLIWNIVETISHLSRAWELRPGDLVYTGTPAGVGPVQRGDQLVGTVTGLEPLLVEIT